jgi:hypothetical protein
LEGRTGSGASRFEFDPKPLIFKILIFTKNPNSGLGRQSYAKTVFSNFNFSHCRTQGKPHAILPSPKHFHSDD